MAILDGVFGIKDACKVVLKDKTTKKPLMYIPYFNSFNIESTNDSVSAMIGTDKVITWNTGRDSTLSCSADVWTMKLFALIAGSDWTTTGADVPMKEMPTVDATAGTVTLAASPVTGSLSIFTINQTDLTNIDTEIIAGTPATTEGQYSIAENVVTFHTSMKGQKVFICYLTHNGTAAELKFMTDNYPKSFYLEGYTTMTPRDASTSSVMRIILPNIQPLANFSLSFDATAPSKNELKFQIMSDATGNYMTLQKVD